ncbi:MAG: sigma-70 family RNA polymerase sigma factor [Planctomycetes bacterium]|nr:sigma-70 family RNA polymerase sigma factor [Planctomycetota bacterium]
MPSSNRSSAPTDDEVLARLLREQDDTGLRRLLDEHGGTVRKGLQKTFGNMLTTNEIDEAISTAAFHAWRSAATYDPEKGSLRAWFFVVARNAGNEILRQRQRRGAEITSGDVERFAAAPGADEANATEDPSAFLLALRECIADLPRVQRGVIEADLRSGGVADAGELAAELGTSKNSIYVSRNTARKTLRRALAERGFDPTDGGPKDGGSDQSWR